MSGNAAVDVLSGGAGFGDVASALMASNFNINSLRPIAPVSQAANNNNPVVQTTLRKDEWLHFDNAVTEVARERLVGIADLKARGLTYGLPNALGKTSVEWEKVSDMNEADVSMAGVTEGQNDRVDYGIDSMPVPIVHKEFSLNIRTLMASREKGEALDTTQAERATRKVSERLESILFNGTTVLGTTKTVYGFTTAPNRNTASVTASWLTATGAQILGDVIRMINAAHADHMYGPFVIYVPLAVSVHLDEDFKAESDKTIRQRLLEISSISEIKSTEQLTGTNIIMYQPTRDVVDLVDGFAPTMVRWETKGGFVQNFKVMSIMVPRFKTDYNDQSGIVHFS